MNRKFFTISLVLILLIILFRLFFHYAHLPIHPDGEQITIVTRILSEPEMKGKMQRFKISLDDGTTVVVSAMNYPQYAYGQTIQLKGNLHARKNKKGQVFYSILYPMIKSSDQANKGTLAIIYGIRQRVSSLFEKSLRPVDAALLLGIVFGIKKGMPEAFYTQLQTAGVLHVIAASGMNVTMVAGALFYLLGKIFSRKRAILWSIMGVWLFALLAGFEPSIVRAAIMGSFAFGAQLLGKQYTAVYALGLTGIIMLLFDPSQLINVGFQLSFLATLGIIILKPSLEAHKKRYDHEKGEKPTKQSTVMAVKNLLLNDDVATTIAALLSTMPILLVNFGKVNILSIIVNAFVLWTIPIISIIGAIAAVVGIFFPTLGGLVLYGSLPFLWYFEIVITYFSRVPVYVTLEEVPISLTVGYYVLLFAYILFRRYKKVDT
jgi:competence protein ComEC